MVHILELECECEDEESGDGNLFGAVLL